MGQDKVLDELVEKVVLQVGKHIVLGLPLGLGKPNRLVNAFYRRACAEPGLRLDIVTALSLDTPQPGHWLEARLMEPIVERQFGKDYPRLEYQVALAGEGPPDNITLTEFYFQSGAALGKASLQRRYISSNYTHVARDLIDRGINVTAQLIAGPDTTGRFSLSCNPDVSLELVRRVRAMPDRTLFSIGQIHPDLPFMHGDAIVEPDFFSEVIDVDPAQTLFALPRMPVSVQDHAVGFHASRLVADGGTLQIGIGSLSDALVHSLMLRHRAADEHRRLRDRLAGKPCSLEAEGGFEQGLFGASEMFMDGFMHLYQAGILKREVFDDIELQQRANAGELVDERGTGALMDGGFFLGSSGFYAFLRGLDESERPRFRMHGVDRINHLYGGSEALEVAQRRHARFINSCMMVTATGAAVSDGLADHQVISGVGGQYNFVAMAHAMDDGRSVLMLRAARGSDHDRTSNIVWEYPHVTIPRHLRDLVVTEYGVAELRGKTDEECIKALIEIMEAPFQDALADKARAAGKLDKRWRIPDRARNNTPARLDQQFADQRERFPDYPFGSDFTATEQRLIPALSRLKRLSASKPRLLKALLRGRPAEHQEALARLGLDQPENLTERLYARLVAAML
ncbi:MAG: acetyl-CoA hydrolase [Wenzhouxiangella sp.]|nr:MAG: acetyl-CoA hydrolase [Wenzhouxiangella sp.]